MTKQVWLLYEEQEWSAYEGEKVGDAITNIVGIYSSYEKAEKERKQQHKQGYNLDIEPFNMNEVKDFSV
jgi:hypothetical protein